MPTFRLFLNGLTEPEIGIASLWTRPANRIEITVSVYWFRLGVHINLHK